jgi:hypothetical protein
MTIYIWSYSGIQILMNQHPPPCPVPSPCWDKGSCPIRAGFGWMLRVELCSPQNSSVEVLFPRTSECDLIWK